jgi:hypothetical protein
MVIGWNTKTTSSLMARGLAVFSRVEAVVVALASTVVEGLAGLRLLVEGVVDDVLVARTRLLRL